MFKARGIHSVLGQTHEIANTAILFWTIDMNLDLPFVQSMQINVRIQLTPKPF